MDDLHAQYLNHELLSAEEETRLIALSKQGDREALGRLITLNYRLIYSVARRYFFAGMTGDQTIEDLMQWGCFGLMKAVEKFNSKKAGKFSTYAVWWIRAYVRRMGIVKGNQFGISYKSGDDRSILLKIIKEGDGKQNHEELARMTGLTVQAVRVSLGSMQDCVELDREARMESGTPVHDLIEDPALDNCEDFADLALNKDVIATVLEDLSPLQQFVIKGRFGFCNDGEVRTHKSLGDELGVSHTEVQNIEKGALSYMRERLMKMYLTSFQFSGY